MFEDRHNRNQPAANAMPPRSADKRSQVFATAGDLVAALAQKAVDTGARGGPLAALQNIGPDAVSVFFEAESRCQPRGQKVSTVGKES